MLPGLPKKIDINQLEKNITYCGQLHRAIDGPAGGKLRQPSVEYGEKNEEGDVISPLKLATESFLKKLEDDGVGKEKIKEARKTLDSHFVSAIAELLKRQRIK